MECPHCKHKYINRLLICHRFLHTVPFKCDGTIALAIEIENYYFNMKRVLETCCLDTCLH